VYPPSIILNITFNIIEVNTKNYLIKVKRLKMNLFELVFVYKFVYNEAKTIKRKNHFTKYQNHDTIISIKVYGRLNV